MALFLESEINERETAPVTVTLLSTKSAEHPAEDEQIIEKTREYAKNAVEKMSAFYKITLTTDIQIFIGNRSDLDSLCGRKTPDWAIGVNGRSVSELVLLDPRLYRNTALDCGNKPETTHDYIESDQQKFLDHEIGHIYFEVILDNGGHGGGPLLWLNEGCQEFASGQYKDNKTTYETFDASIINPTKVDGKFYGSSGIAVARLVEVFGQDEFVSKLTVVLNAVGGAFKENFGFELTKENLTTFVKTGQIPL